MAIENTASDTQVAYEDGLTKLVDTHEPKPEHTDQEVLFLEGTMMRVFNSLVESGLTRDQALDGITSMQNAGILFRERFKL